MADGNGETMNAPHHFSDLHAPKQMLQKERSKTSACLLDISLTLLTDWHFRIPRSTGTTAELPAALQGEASITAKYHTVIIEIRGSLSRYLVAIWNSGMWALNRGGRKLTPRGSCTPSPFALSVTGTADGALSNEVEFHSSFRVSVAFINYFGSIWNIICRATRMLPIFNHRRRRAHDC